MNPRRSSGLPILLLFLVLAALLVVTGLASAQWDGSKSKPPIGNAGGTPVANGGGDPDNPVPLSGGSNPENYQGGSVQPFFMSLGEGEEDLTAEDLLRLLGTITGVLGSVLLL